MSPVLQGGGLDSSLTPPPSIVLDRPSSFRGSFAEGEQESKRSLRASKSSTTLAGITRRRARDIRYEPVLVLIVACGIAALAVKVVAAEQSEAELLFLCNAGLSIAEATSGPTP